MANGSDMPRHERRLAKYRQLREHPNIRALLDMVARYEVGTVDPDGYNVIFGGQRISDLSRHPDIKKQFKGGHTTAAGRYQFLTSTWHDIQRRLTGPLPDFGPESQDLAILAYMEEKGVDLDGIMRGNLDQLFSGGRSKGLGSIFASMPVEKPDGTYYFNYKGQSGPDPVAAREFMRDRMTNASYQVPWGGAGMAWAPAGMYGQPSMETLTMEAPAGVQYEMDEEQEAWQDLEAYAQAQSINTEADESDPMRSPAASYVVTPYLMSKARRMLGSMAGRPVNVTRDGRRMTVNMSEDMAARVARALDSMGGQVLPADMADYAQDLVTKALEAQA